MIQTALAAAAAAAAAAVPLTQPPQHPMPRHWLRPVHFSPLATNPSLLALSKRIRPMLSVHVSVHVHPDYFIECVLIAPLFLPCRLKEFHERTRAVWEEKMRGDGSGGVGKELRKAVSLNCRHNKKQPCYDGVGVGDDNDNDDIFDFHFRDGVRCSMLLVLLMRLARLL